MYRFYMKQGEKQVLLPIPPSEIETKIGNNNKSIYMLNMGQMNLLRSAGLQEMRFTLLLPGRKWSFVQTENDFLKPSYFLDLFYEFKISKKPVSLILFRVLADGTQLFCGNTEMALEEYRIIEKGGEQGDFWVEMCWKEYRAVKSIRYDMKKGVSGYEAEMQGVARESKAPAKTYTVKKGDTLWGIAKGQTGDGSRFREIAKNNNIADPNKIYPGQVLILG